MSMRNPNGFIRPGYDPLQVADAPTEVTPTAGSEAASVDFTPPSNVGGAAVSEYYAVVQPGNITATSVTPPVAVSGLTNGTEYTTKVWANNSYGPSPYSAESSGFTPVPPNVEDVFSTYLYNGTGSAQTINNGIDLDGEGGLVWIKNRGGAYSHVLYDTDRGVNLSLSSNTTSGNANQAPGGVVAYNSNGFSLDSNSHTDNNSTGTFASWTFRKQPKFFDVVTWTGNDAIGRQIPHSLGSVPGCIIVKATSRTSNWAVYHRSIGNNSSLFLNNTDATTTPVVYWNSTNPTSTEFTIGDGGQVNENGQTYVAYLFAHDAGGFGDDDEQNVISCGSYTGNGSSTGPVINLGYEPQWVLIKDTTSGVQDWILQDTMRGMTVTADVGAYVKPNTSSAEFATSYVTPQPTGFQINQTSGQVNTSGNTYIYIAIRRGPMKTPESGTEVFNSELVTATQATKIVTGIGFSPDLLINGVRSNANYGQQVTDRLRGVNKQLFTNYSSSESTTNGTALVSLDMDGFTLGADTAGTGWNAYSGFTSVKWAFKRAPGFMDVVAYTGTGVAHTEAHNLGVAPELVIIKSRSNANGWVVGSSLSPNVEDYMWLYLTSAWLSGSFWNNTRPTATEFSVSTGSAVNGSGLNFIAYLFATLAGVSKVGTYSGTGADLNVDCGFSAGARFVLIKRTDDVGDWYVWDSARGIVSGNDPYLLLNSAAAEVTSTDYIDPLASGFTVTSSAPAALNASGGSYIFLAIA